MTGWKPGARGSTAKAGSPVWAVEIKTRYSVPLLHDADGESGPGRLTAVSTTDFLTAFRLEGGRPELFPTNMPGESPQTIRLAGPAFLVLVAVVQPVSLGFCDDMGF